jgi:hypothetical protein
MQRVSARGLEAGSTAAMTARLLPVALDRGELAGISGILATTETDNSGDYSKASFTPNSLRRISMTPERRLRRTRILIQASATPTPIEAMILSKKLTNE